MSLSGKARRVCMTFLQRLQKWNGLMWALFWPTFVLMYRSSLLLLCFMYLMNLPRTSVFVSSASRYHTSSIQQYFELFKDDKKCDLLNAGNNP